SILSALCMLLEWEGYRVSGARDGVEGRQALERERPDLLITDYMMPAMDGGELVRWLRGTPSMSGMPVILISAVPEFEAELDGLVDAFIRKPPNLDRLLELVRRGVEDGRAALRDHP